IGFDIIFAYSANRFPGFDKQGEYDWSFLAALKEARHRIVLARSGRAYPAEPFIGAVFDPAADVGRTDPAAIAYAELAPDADGVFRRVTPQVESTDGETLTTFAAALLVHAKGRPMPAEVMLAPARPLEAIPAYGLIDVLRCIDASPAALRQAFAGRVVLIGTNLPEEDRKPTPDRFMRPAVPRDSQESGCKLDRLGASDPGSGTAPGVFVHAAAVQEVLNGNLVTPLPAPGRALAASLTAIGGALLGFALRPLFATLGLAALVLLCLAAAPALLGSGIWFPVLLPVTAAVAALVVAYVARFLIEERRRRRVQSAFGQYLSPVIVDQLVDSEAPLRLGGEEREVTIMFADLSGFTALSGKVGPAELMSVTNAYLALIVEAVESTGGYVDKFIGDAVMGIWGAPVPNLDHAAAAARASLRAVAAIVRAKTEADARHLPGYSLKIGLNSGRAVIGNVGAEKRYNYTAVGETVNIASRLESVPGDYGCRIVVGPDTAAAIRDRFVLNELDWVKVKGKEAPLTVYELVAEKEGADGAVLGYPEAYQVALGYYRAGRFAEAEECWRRHVTHPYLTALSPPLVMAERAAEYRETPPPVDWDGVYIKTAK
ncbi:MAG TPA: adenylate/guanylate cyclase domain-containing protein, partial [Stellaceae bacterium]|nr:adenylate/guanylate cyclase domain-containing protein [Stellaceae bacterium]